MPSQPSLPLRVNVRTLPIPHTLWLLPETGAGAGAADWEWLWTWRILVCLLNELLAGEGGHAHQGLVEELGFAKLEAFIQHSQKKDHQHRKGHACQRKLCCRDLARQAMPPSSSFPWDVAQVAEQQYPSIPSWSIPSTSHIFTVSPPSPFLAGLADWRVALRSGRVTARKSQKPNTMVPSSRWHKSLVWLLKERACIARSCLCVCTQKSLKGRRYSKQVIIKQIQIQKIFIFFSPNFPKFLLCMTFIIMKKKVIFQKTLSTYSSRCAKLMANCHFYFTSRGILNGAVI